MFFQHFILNKPGKIVQTRNEAFIIDFTALPFHFFGAIMHNMRV